MRDFISIPGSKELATPYLWQFIPRGTTEMVCPFLGSAKFERWCASHGIETWGSDKDIDHTNFWRWMLKEPELMAELARLLEPLVDADRFERRKWELEDMELGPLRAVEWWLINRCSWNNGGLVTGYSGYMRNKLRNSRYFEAMEQFYCPNLHVERLDYREALKKRPDMLAYCDPPYKSYQMLYRHHLIDHGELHSILSKRDQWLLSYGKHPKILDLYKSFEIVDLSGLWHKGMGRGKGHTNEILIVSHDIVIPDGFKRCA